MVKKGANKASAQVSEGIRRVLQLHSFLKPLFAVTGRAVNASVYSERAGGVSEYRSIQFRSHRRQTINTPDGCVHRLTELHHV